MSSTIPDHNTFGSLTTKPKMPLEKKPASISIEAALQALMKADKTVGQEKVKTNAALQKLKGDIKKLFEDSEREMIALNEQLASSRRQNSELQALYQNELNACKQREEEKNRMIKAEIARIEAEALRAWTNVAAINNTAPHNVAQTQIIQSIYQDANMIAHNLKTLGTQI